MQFKKVPTNQRPNFLPRKFGMAGVRLESVIFSFMRELTDDYNGGYWEFMRGENNTFFLFPDIKKPEMTLQWAGNFSCESMTPEAAGIVATLFGLCYMAEQSGADMFTNAYHDLLEATQGHPEAAKILRLID